MTAKTAGAQPVSKRIHRQSFHKAAWLFYGLACLFPYLVGVYLILGIDTDISYAIVNILGLTLILILLGALLIETFAKRLRYLSRRIALNIYAGATEKLPTQENDLEEVYMLTQGFNSVFEEMERHKKHSQEITAQMIAYVNDLAEYEKKFREESLIRANIGRYVGKDVVDELIRSDHSGFENVECVATVLFADIRRFTRISEDMQPENIITILNDYFEAMVPVVFKYGGTLDKFVGDELMAVFRDNPYGERAPLRAVRAGIEMIDVLKHAGSNGKQNISTLEIGIGINTGKVVIGNVGSENRKDYTAIGDTVNVASRLEQMASGQEIIVGEKSYEICHHDIPMQKIGPVNLRNRKKTVMGYRVLMDSC